MAYKKPPERTAQEWAAMKSWQANPVQCIKDWFKCTPDDWQGDVLNAIFTKTDRVAMKACHGPGKTTIDAWVGWLFLNFYENSRVVATAPTFSQLHDVLFPEYAKWHSKMPQRIQDEWQISGGHIRHKIKPYDWFAVARTSNQPANLQGFHGANLLIEADEASAVPANVFEVIEGALSEAGEDGKVAKLLMGGNPNFNSGELHDAFYRNADLYHRITITGDVDLLGKLSTEQGGYHPEHGFMYRSPRVKAKYVQTIERKYGKDSAIFDVRVRGIFPRAADDALIPLEWAEKGALLETPQFDPVADAFSVVVDVSRGGAAETVIGVARKGIVTHFEAHKATRTSHITAGLVNDVVLREKAKGLHLSEIIVDAPGVGGGVIDVLRADYELPVRGYDGGKPLVRGVDPDDECKLFRNRRARDWWLLRRRLEVGNYPIPNDETLIAQLASVKYKYDSQDKIVAESKQDMKDRLGPEASPDRGDMIVMAQAPVPLAETTRIDTDADVLPGEDRDTADYRAEMDMGLV